MPGLVIAAHGADRTYGVHRTDQNDIVIRIGYLTWILADNLAFRSMTEAWERAREAGEKVLPTSAAAKGDTNRRRVLPRPTLRFL